MDYGILFGLLHQFVGCLLYPVIIALGVALCMLLWEFGQTIAERFLLLDVYRQPITNTTAYDVLVKQFQDYANKRLERVDLLARGGPVLGLMGTLIPLGPGLAALGNGNIDILATALMVAFDTTVLGLFVGLFSYIIGRVRRRWYESTWQTFQASYQKLSPVKQENMNAE